MASSKTQRMYQTVSDKGTLTVNVYGSPGEDGKQAVAEKIEFDATLLPDAITKQFLAKGLGFYMSSATADAEGPAAIAKGCRDFFLECEKGNFTPGRSAGETRPSAFHEALAEHLQVPVHVLQERIKEDPAKYNQKTLSAMGRHPAIAALTARIEKERAAERERDAKKRAKDARPLDADELLAGLRAAA